MPRRLLALSVLAVAAGVLVARQPQPKPDLVKKANRTDTLVATLAAVGLPNLDGQWLYAGPFDHPADGGFDTQYPPEKGPFDPKATFAGKNAATFGWKELPKFKLGTIYDLAKLFPGASSDAVVYLRHEFQAKEKCSLPLSLGTDDTLTVYFNGKRLIHENYMRPAAPDQDEVTLDVKPGKNELLVRVGQYGGGWELYAAPEVPDLLPKQIAAKLDGEFPKGSGGKPAKVVNSTEENKFYKMFTLPVPADCVLEVGGLGFRPDGKLLACTRRGEVWLIDNPTSESLTDIKFGKYAGGLHEALGLWVEDDKTVYVVQRPELTKLVDKAGTGKTATEFTTFCDKWGVSGDYHEFAFGPARDPKTGDFYVTLNVGFGGGHQAKGAWRGWCVKVTPKGDLEPFAYGIRSPNGVNVSPEGDLFYTDNQGEWVATNKMHHLQKGKFYGHQAGLRWVKDSPFAGKVPEKVASGMMYDGQPAPGKTAPKGMPELAPPCVWFPYGRMGQSISEPIWDTTKGKFGPFGGQCFVGDQYTAVVMRVALEKVNGVYQGACFPFRAGFQCGVNRLTFGPDGALYVGQTNRGWGSLGGKPHGLQRISFTGADPMEVHHVTLTKAGFDFTFTKPVDPDTVNAKAVALKSFTYVYSSQYGYPETDTKPEPVTKMTLSDDKKTVSLSVADLHPGRVYDFKWNGVKALSGEALLHPEAYYTLNELVK